MGDDRESPSEELIGELEHNQAQVTIVDPYIEETAVYGTLESDVYTALEDADALVLMTAHQEFRDLDFEKVKELMKIPIIIDARRIYDPEKLREMGFHYSGVGAVNNSY